MRELSLFTGVGGGLLGTKLLGWKSVGYVEWDGDCRKVLRARIDDSTFDDAPIFSDVREFDGKAWLGKVDVLTGGFPCFVSGTLILTKTGFIPIEDVRVGNEVLTHGNRWRKVLSVMSKVAPTVCLKGQGHYGLETTVEHPFWSRTKSFKSTRIEGKSICVKTISDPTWKPAQDMFGSFWATPSDVPFLEIPGMSIEHANETIPCEIDENFFRLVGLWLGDGWLLDGNKSEKENDVRTIGKVVICCNKKDFDVTKMIFDSCELKACISEDRTTWKFIVSSKPLTRWLEVNFGRYSYDKKMPSWVLGMGLGFRKALFEGYLMADGCVVCQRSGSTYRQSSTVSRALALGIKILAASLGVAYTEKRFVNKRVKSDGDCIIEGRKVNERPSYQLSFWSTSRSAFFDSGFLWGRVRSISPGDGLKLVHNLEVEEDNSYVADGMVVHNCQPFTVSGQKKGQDDVRNMWPATCRILGDVNPQWALFENVPGLLQFEYFGQILSDIGRCGYDAFWMVLSAGDVGALHRRARLWIICRKRDGNDVPLGAAEKGWGRLISFAADRLVFADEIDGRWHPFLSVMRLKGIRKWPVSGMMVDGRCFRYVLQKKDNERFPFHTPEASRIDDGFNLKTIIKGKFINGSQKNQGIYERMRMILMESGISHEEGSFSDVSSCIDIRSSLGEIDDMVLSERKMILTDGNSLLWKRLFLNPDWSEWLMGWPVGHTKVSRHHRLDVDELEGWKDVLLSGDQWKRESDIPRVLVSSGDREWEQLIQVRHKQIGNGQFPLCVFAVWRLLERANDMTDRVSPKTRSGIMAAIGGKGTTPEERMAEVLSVMGIECGRNVRGLPGTPDFVLPGKVIMFVDGCFWHGCPEHHSEPKSNAEFWRNKIGKNRDRDVRVDSELAGLGYRVIHIWEHDLKRKTDGEIAETVRKKMKA